MDSYTYPHTDVSMLIFAYKNKYVGLVISEFMMGKSSSPKKESNSLFSNVVSDSYKDELITVLIISVS